MVKGIENLNHRSKRKDLIAALREQIIAGAWKNGMRFPSYEQLGKVANASKATLQFAVTRLQQDGYLIGKERKGLFVAEKLPCFQNFRLLIRESEKNNLFYRKLSQAAEEISRDGIGFRTCFYTGNPNEAGWMELTADLQNLRVGGILFASDMPRTPEEIALEQDLHFPKIQFGYHQRNASTIQFHINTDVMIRKCLAFFRSRSMHRVALLMMEQQPSETAFRELAPVYGIELRNMLIQAVPYEDRNYAANLMELLLHLPQSLRPEAVIINDENLLPPVLEGLANVPLSIREKILFVSHVNFPEDATTAFPVRRIGFDTKELIRSAVRRICDWHHSGNAEPGEILPYWEDEIKESSRNEERTEL